MDDRVMITGIPPFDGEYELDLGTRTFSTLEWRWIKKISGYLPLTIREGLEGGDPDIFVVMALIALYRAGKVQKEQIFSVADVLSEPPFDGSSIQIIVAERDDEAGDERPPEFSPTTNGLESSSAVGQFESENTNSSGPSAGADNGASSAPSPLRIGDPGSATSADFDQAISSS